MQLLAIRPDLNEVKSFANEHRVALLATSAVLALGYLFRKFYIAGGKCRSKRRLDGKTVIITGANAGIGKETAIDLAKRGARVILACRDPKRAQEAAKEVRKKSGNGNVVVEILDLASLASVRAFAQRILAQETQINILINNAAVMGVPPTKTVDGFELQFGTNHLGHFLLTNLLLDRMKESAPSRIVVVSALGHEWTYLNWDDLMSERDYEPWNVYKRTKLANVLFSNELARRLKGTGVTVNSLHPGVIYTDLGDNYVRSFGALSSLIVKLLTPLRWYVMKTAREGAQTNIYCAVAEELDGVSGVYYSDCAPRPLLPRASNMAHARRLWTLSEALVATNN